MKPGMKIWMEVVPSLLEFPRRPSGTITILDTIPEEDGQEDESFEL